MSADRESYNAINEFLSGKRISDLHWQALGEHHVWRCLKEFFKEHDNIAKLSFSLSHPPQVEIEGVRYKTWQVADPKLRVCLMALDQKLKAMKDVIQILFAEDEYCEISLPRDAVLSYEVTPL